MEPNKPQLLQYAPVRAHAGPLWRRLPGQVLRGWQSLPLPVAAVMLLIPVYTAMYFVADEFRETPASWVRFGEFMLLIPLYLAAAIRRGRWRDLGIAIVICAITYGLSELVLVPGWTMHRLFRWPVMFFVRLLGFAVLQWIWVKRDERGSIIPTLLATAGVASAVAIVDTFLGYLFTDRFYNRWGDELTDFSPNMILHPLVNVVIGGFFIPLAICATLRSRRAVTVELASLSAIAAFVALFGPLLVPIARNSIAGNGPFTPDAGVELISEAGTSSSYDYLYEVLEQSGYVGQTSPTSRTISTTDHAIAVLSKRDAARLAERASARFRAHPKHQLAETYCRLFAEQHRYETAPLLLRYCFLDLAMDLDDQNSYHYSHHVSPKVEALESMRIQHVAPVIVSGVWVWITSQDRNYSFDDVTHSRLARLVGRDPGPGPAKWGTLIQESIASGATPLTPQLRHEADDVLAAGEKYYAAVRRLISAHVTVVTVAPPNFDAVTTDQFVHEVDLYDARVNAAIQNAR